MIKHYLATDIPSFDWPNFNYMLRDIGARFADRVAFRYRARGAKEFEAWSYERLGREGAALASFLYSRGLAGGDRVAIWSENRPEWGCAYMAIVAAGFVAVPIDTLLPEDEVGRVLQAAEIGAVIASGRFARNLDRLPLGPRRGESGDPARLAGRAGPTGAGPASLSFATWAKPPPSPDGPGLPAPETIAPDADASIIFTSGTTGAPKGVVLSHSGIIANFDASIHSLPITKDGRLHVRPAPSSQLPHDLQPRFAARGRRLDHDRRESRRQGHRGRRPRHGRNGDDRRTPSLRQARPGPGSGSQGQGRARAARRRRAVRSSRARDAALGFPGLGRAIFKGLRVEVGPRLAAASRRGGRALEPGHRPGLRRVRLQHRPRIRHERERPPHRHEHAAPSRPSLGRPRREPDAGPHRRPERSWSRQARYRSVRPP